MIIAPQSGFSQKGSVPAPPNCVKLYDNIFIDKTEISNIHWLEYLYYVQRDSSEVVYKAALPDTTVWLSYQDTSRYEHYFRSYREFPVVGITQQQAEAYCQWRSYAVNNLVKTAKKKEKRKRGLEDDQNVIFRFRLPTEKEWMAAAEGLLDKTIYPYGFIDYMGKSTLIGKPEDLYEKTDKSRSFEEFEDRLEIFNNGKNEPKFNVLKKFDHYFFYGDSFPRAITFQEKESNTLGVHNMIGNVAEIVAETGFVKGGGWVNTLEESTISIRQRFTKPEAWIGFRCACEVELIPATK